MRGVNKVILVGTLGRDPETKTFPNGGSLTQFSIATSEAWTDKNTGERKEQTEWHRIVLHNRLGEIAQQFLRKGSKVYIEGSLRTRQWTDQNGQERYTTEIRGDQMQMLDARQQGEQGFAGGNDFNQPRFNELNKVVMVIKIITTKVAAMAKTAVVMVAKVVSVMVEATLKRVVLRLKRHNNQLLHQLI